MTQVTIGRKATSSTLLLLVMIASGGLSVLGYMTGPKELAALSLCFFVPTAIGLLDRVLR